MNQPIAGYHKDAEDNWVAELACRHFQHVRHDPPWTERDWTTTASGRQSMIGFQLNCLKCDEHAPPDQCDVALKCGLETSVPDWLIEHPSLLSLFQTLGIDYCCGGKSLETACREQELAPEYVLAQMRKQLGSST